MIKAKRIALKVSGEALGSAQSRFNLEFVQQFVKSIIASKGDRELVLVVGGGNFLRGKDVENTIQKAKADHMGMLATIMNGIFLKEIFEKNNQKTTLLSNVFCPSVCDLFSIDRAHHALQQGHVVICTGGTSIPHFTTDTAVVLKACELECDLIMKATKVKGIYSKDPRHHEDAQFFDRLTFAQVLEKKLNVMDVTAFEMAQQHNIPIVVFSVTESMHNVLESQCEYTIVGESDVR